jgi:two-component system response regulator HydG
MLPSETAFDTILGESTAARAMRCFGRKAAAVDATVLITGETGTGKGILARAIHLASRRSRQEFVAVNCAGIPEGLFESEFFGHVRGAFTGALQNHRGLIEQAHLGTLFLDEVGEVSAPMQAKLLTALEDHEVRRVGAERTLRVDFRTIAATAADLEEMVGRNTFRADLFHRLKILFIRVAPLRQRMDDLPLLATFYATLYASKYQRATSLPLETISFLQSFSWPGNIRELAHSIEAAVVECEHGPLRPGHFRVLNSSPPRPAPPLPGGRYAFNGSRSDELATILEALRICEGNKTRAARRLGMSRNTLINKLRDQSDT